MSDAATRVLVVEDETLFASAVKRHLQRAGHEVQVAGTLADARAALEGDAPLPSLVLLDMRLPDGSGFDLLEALFEPTGAWDGAPPPVIVMTAFGDLQDAVAAMKVGAADYLKKPVDLDELALNVDRVLAQHRVTRQLDYSRSRERSRATPPRAGAGGTAGGTEYHGDSEPARVLREQIDTIAGLARAETPPNVLILGETGTGKGLIARLLHDRSVRAERPFVHVDCTALPADLVESELFGHRKGAFTGATADRTGLIEAAEDGTVFLDEIGELPLETQSKLLTVLDRRCVRRVGSSAETAVTAWFIAATNRDLEEEVAAGRFRSDLYYRLKVLALESPSLRERPEDVVPLAERFAAQTSQRFGLPVPAIDDAACDALRRYHWPGNVRELSHLIERGVLLGGGRSLSVAQLFGTGGPVAPDAGAGRTGGRDQRPVARPGEEGAAPGPGDAAAADTPAQADRGASDPPDAAREPGSALSGLTLADAERLLIADALERTEGNVSQAARELGVTRMTLRYRMKQHGLDRPGRQD